MDKRTIYLVEITLRRARTALMEAGNCPGAVGQIEDTLEEMRAAGCTTLPLPHRMAA